MDGSVANPQPFKAIAIRIAAAFAISTMAMLIKVAGERGVHLAELLFWRQAIASVLVAGFLIAAGRIATVKTKRFSAHFRRAFVGLVSMCFLYGTVLILPLAEATAINFTAPFFAVMLSVILFKEQVGKYRWGAVFFGFMGVLVITQPGGNAINPMGVATGLIGAFFVALISYQVQDLNKTESPWSIVFWFGVLSAPMAAFALPFFASHHDPTTWMIIIAMAVSGGIAQLLLTASLRFGSAATIIIIDYTSLLWAVGYGWGVFDKAPTSGLWLGAPLILGAGLLIARREALLARDKRRSAAQA
ncbi:DMT family transporter [Altererythrobacter lutimaris]|uniref:DMT family transporter n=1 Tax=Altererythrobacter lutimaris TaxID=2743979 RepID=A0A850HCE3_9SPHN|nr:DMT family transporter [Altererythrobacter lutimaris]NVE94596.1 DMT family transporter [Altererythrobacter lutimaris]